MQLSDKIARHWSGGTSVQLAPQERPSSLEYAEKAQDQLVASLDLVAVAWKLGASNKASQASLGLPRPFSGLLPVDRVHASGETLDVSGWRHRGVECELAVPLLRDIDPGERSLITAAYLEPLLGPVHPSLEIPDTRFKTLATTEGPLALVADNGAVGRAVIGGPSGYRIGDIDKECTVNLLVDGRQVAMGTTDALIAAPLDLVTDHVTRMLARGYQLRRGEFVLLGSLTAYHNIDRDCVVKADFGALGIAEIRYIGIRPNS